MPVTAVDTRPVDLTHLAQYTGGDAALNAEVLQLFATQVTEILQQLARVLDSKDSKAWRQAAHTMKGAARGIGAFSLADAAASAEPIVPESDIRAALDALREINARADAVRLFIDAYLNR